MRKIASRRALSRRFWVCFVISAGCVNVLHADETPAPVERTPWRDSRIVGSPDPPLPYQTEEVFAQIPWDQPLYIKAEPGTDSMLVVLQGGEKDKPSRVVRLRDTPTTRNTELVLELDRRLIYGLEFHPDYVAGGDLFVFSNGPTGEPERMNRISRFTIDTESPRTCRAESEQTVIEWRSMGHDGGDVAFGRDGMLYISSGDGTSDSDEWLSAQDVSSLLGGVLRINVSHPSPDTPYSIPKDNPYLELPGARGELWAIGLRNPWRMTADRQTGQVWVGNNGQDLWETAQLIQRGENYGWSVYEGNHPFYLSRQRGPGPIVGPTIEHHHRDFRSLTGGVVYYGGKLPELRGTYVYGDYATGKIWGARHDGQQLSFHQELADTTLQIAGFAISPTEELLVVDHGGALHRLIDTPRIRREFEFPRRLSQTGVFRSTKDHEVAAGVIPYSVSAAGWADGAKSARFLALPGASQLDYTAAGGWNLPEGAVVLQTLTVPQPQTEGNSRRRIETRLLTRQESEWVGYSYVWNDAQDDATLVGSDGADVELTAVDDQGKPTTQAWRIPSRAECLSCHSRAANFLLGVSTLQLNRPNQQDSTNQLEMLGQMGLFKKPPPQSYVDSPHLVDPYDESGDLGARVRSYLHVNCAGCHIRAGGGNARMELEFSKPMDAMNLIAEHPQHANLGISRARLVTPGEPSQSVLFRRISLRGPGQMPPLVTRRVDRSATKMFESWISQLETTQTFVRAWTVAELLPDLATAATPTSTEAGRKVYEQLRCHQCHRIAGDGGGAGPDLSDISRRMKLSEILEAVVEPSKRVTPDFAATIIETADGRVFQGRIEQETATTIRLRTAESFAEPITVDVADIEARYLSTQSIMPAGLLNTIDRESILELLSYLSADHQPR